MLQFQNTWGASPTQKRVLRGQPQEHMPNPMAQGPSRLRLGPGARAPCIRPDRPPHCPLTARALLKVQGVPEPHGGKGTSGSRLLNTSRPSKVQKYVRLSHSSETIHVRESCLPMGCHLLSHQSRHATGVLLLSDFSSQSPRQGSLAKGNHGARPRMRTRDLPLNCVG